MSLWLDSNNSNKFKQSYFRDFVDVSGDIKIRNGLSLQLYNNNSDSTSTFSINSKEINIYDGISSYYDISNTKLIYIKDLSENVQDRLTNLTYRTKYIDSDVSKVLIDTNLIINGDNSYNVGIGKNDPSVVLDISSSDAVRLPYGTTDQRPITTGEAHKGYIRYNSQLDQFEGYGAGNAWGSLGGVVNIAQDTYVKAGEDEHDKELLFYTDGVERMRIDATGDISMNNLYVSNDVSLNSKLYVQSDASFNGRVDICGEFYANYPENSIPVSAILGEVPTSTINEDNNALLLSDLTVGGNTVLNGPVTINNNADSHLIVKSDVSFNSNLTVSGEVLFHSDVSVNGNFTAKYPIESIPPTAIMGVGSVDGGINVGVYISDEVKFDDGFVIVKEDKDKISLTPYGIFVTDDVTYDEDDFAIFKENKVPTVKTDLNLSGDLFVYDNAYLNGNTFITTVSAEDYSNAAASTIFVKSQNFIHNDALMRQFIS